MIFLTGPGGKKPIIAKDGTVRDLKINEIEQAMGFQSNYTSIMYGTRVLSKSKRLSKVGKSCSVDTLTELLQFFTFFFETTSI